MIAARSARRPSLPIPSEANPDGRPTRPDKLSIWPTEDERFGIDVLYVGPQGHRRGGGGVGQNETGGARRGPAGGDRAAPDRDGGARRGAARGGGERLGRALRPGRPGGDARGSQRLRLVN